MVPSAGCGPAEPTVPVLAPPRSPDRIEHPVATGSSDRPNLILVSIDTLRADHLGAYGYDRETSPHIDALADDGVLFERAYAQSPKTAPSHMTLFTGLYPEAHRVRNRMSGDARWLGRLSDDLPTLAEMLAAAGYRTVARTGGGNMHGAIGFARGFDSFETPEWSDAQGIFQAALENLEELAAGSTPFFLLVHTYQVHAPYTPPPQERERFVDPDYSGEIVSDYETLAAEGPAEVHRAFWRRVDPESAADRRHLSDLYDACIHFTDGRLGLLLERLEALGRADDTLVVVLSDHGEEFGEHGGFGHDALWQELLHVPLVMRVPEGVRPGWRGRRIEASVGLVDVLPTLLELLELPVPAHLQGRSLVPLVERGEHPPPWIFAQHRERGDVALLADDWKLLRDHGDARLFELGADAGERNDLAEKRQAVRRALRAQAERVLFISRAYWKLAREAPAAGLDPAERERLEALGYAEESP
jgi:arylsulfatase A-like enzyme